MKSLKDDIDGISKIYSKIAKELYVRSLIFTQKTLLTSMLKLRIQKVEDKKVLHETLNFNGT